jgi:hypothetical protein
MKRKSGKVRPVSVEGSQEVVGLAPGWTTNVWAVSDFFDSSGTYPQMRVRAEIVGAPKRPRAVVTSLVLGDGVHPVTPAQVNAVGRIMPRLAGIVLAHWTMADGTKPDPDAFVRAMSAATRTKGRTMVQREDEALDKWERVYQPKGLTQREAAEDMGLAHSTFRSYLTHARARRGN